MPDRPGAAPGSLPPPVDDAGGRPAPFAIDGSYLLAGRDGTMAVGPKSGPPPRIDGLTFGFHHVDTDSPHGGEMHPDGDELLVVLSGAVTVELVDDDGAVEEIPVPAGHGCVVPRGLWHRLLVDVPSTIWHATPGPGFHLRWERPAGPP